MAKIVISYRRADSEALTGRIRDRLVGHYGDNSIFMDIDSIPLGTDFRDYIKEVLEHTDLVIAVMGPRWLGAVPGSTARIMEETDPVRIEVESALARGVSVIPILIDNATMPQPSELPSTLTNLAYRNAAQVESGRDFHLHMDRVIRAIDKILPGAAIASSAEARAAQPATQSFGPRTTVAPPTQIAAAAPGKRRWGLWLGIAAAVPLLVLGSLLVIGLLAGDPKKGPTTTVTVTTSPDPTPPAPAPTPPTPPPPTPAPTPPTPPIVQPAPTPPTPPPPVRPPPVNTAATCGGSSTLAFQDSFSTPVGGWDETSSVRLFERGEMVFRFREPGLLSWLYRPMRFKNASVCITVRAPSGANKVDGAASGGVVFWAIDYANYYLAQVYLDGSYQVFRRLSGEWISVLPRTKSERLVAGAGAVNRLQVTLKDGAGTLSANGEKIAEFRGTPPKDGGAVGLHAESEPDRGAEWRFLSIAVADDEALPPKPVPERARRAAERGFACKAGPDVAFADDFSKPDAAWGQTNDTVFYENGQFVLKPPVNSTRRPLYLRLRYANATACVHVRWPTNAVQTDEIASGGLLFWGENGSNLYAASLFRDGTYDIYRMLDNQWLAIVRRTATSAIKRAPDAVNQVKVATVDNKATVFINDTRVAEIVGQPPRAGGSFGLFAQSDKERISDWRFTAIAVAD